MTQQAMRSIKQSILWLVFLGPFFFLAYGFSNWWTSQLTDVGSIVFDWEHHIPFIPWFIWPYMSIDLFFALSLFLPQTRSALNTHAHRLIAAIVVSVIGFLLFPLQFSFNMPPTEGLTGLAFQALLSFDQPYNQAPSLHISLLIILWYKYAQVLKGLLRRTLDLWFFLIFISVLFVYQHHAIDVITGAVVGIFCLYLFPETGWRKMISKKNKRLCLRYGLSGTLLILLAFLIQGIGWLLLWPAVALCIVALGYAGIGSAIFQKGPNGKHAWPARLILKPFLYGAKRSANRYNRHLEQYTMINSTCAIGGIHAPKAKQWDVVLDLAAEFEASPPTSKQYYSLPVLDLTSPKPSVIQDALSWLSQHPPTSTICIHCALGLSRSAIMMAAWLVKSGQMRNAEEAFSAISEKRPIVWRKEHEQLVDQVCTIDHQPNHRQT